MEAAEYEVMAAVEDRHWWYSGMRAISAAWLDPLLLGRRALRVLDAGCGSGGNGEFLGRYGRTVGLDLAALATGFAARRMPGRVARGSVMTLPFADHSFDLVTSFDVLYHRAVLDVDQALGESVRVLKPGGLLLLRLPAYAWLSSAHDQAVHGQTRFTAAQTSALLAQAGLRLLRISYCNSLLFPVALTQRLLERVRPVAADHASALLPPSPLINTLLRTTLDAEAVWLARGGQWPWGLSVLALATLPADSENT